MSTVESSPATLEYSTPPAEARGQAGVIVAWILIVSTVLFVGVRTWQSARSAALAQATDELTMEMTARGAVGYHVIFAAGARHDENTIRLSSEITSTARTPGEKLRAVAVIGELEGSAAALDELNAISPLLSASPLSADAAAMRTIYTAGVADLSSRQREDLLRLGWFGKLALSFQRPITDPLRRTVVVTGTRAIGAAFGMELLLLGLGIGGIILFTIATVRLIDRKVTLAYRPPQSRAGPFLEAFALYLTGYVGISWVIHKFADPPTWVLYSVDLAWVAFACCWPMLRGVSWSELRRGLGWTAGRGVFREAGAGILGYLAGVPILAIAVYLSAGLARWSGERPIHPMVFGAGSDLRTILTLFLLASVFAPIVEETMFRGALFHHLRFRHGWLFSAALSSLIFASLHPQGWTAIPLLGSIGFIFAGIRQWRGTAIASATAHALNNAVATTMLILVLG